MTRFVARYVDISGVTDIRRSIGSFNLFAAKNLRMRIQCYFALPFSNLIRLDGSGIGQADSDSVNALFIWLSVWHYPLSSNLFMLNGER